MRNLIRFGLLFLLTIVASAQNQIREGYYTIRAKHSKEVLTITEGTQLEGAEVVTASSSGKSHQKFFVSLIPNEDYVIIPTHSGKPLAVPEYSLFDYVHIRQETPNNEPNQQWKIISSKEYKGFYRIESRSSGKCLHAVLEWDFDNPIEQMECTGANNQLFSFEGSDDREIDYDPDYEEGEYEDEEPFVDDEMMAENEESSEEATDIEFEVEEDISEDSNQ